MSEATQVGSSSPGKSGSCGVQQQEPRGLWKGTWSGPIAAIPMEGSQGGHL